MLFHISTDDNLSNLTPKVPDLTLGDYEDHYIKRICCCHHIGNCLKAVNPFRGDMFYVYEIIYNSNVRIMNHHEVVEYVADAEYTKENWILEEVKVRKIGKIEILEGGFYNLRKVNKFGEVFDAIDRVKWKWVEKYERNNK